MMKQTVPGVTLALAFFLHVGLWSPSARAQGNNGSIAGTATDTDHAVLPGAPVKVDPGNVSLKTNAQGEFTISDVAPGAYTVTVSYLGFSDYTASVTVTAGQMTRVDAVLGVSSLNEQVVVTAGRSFGEAETVNEIRAADNLINILPAEVVTSLPNANIADAVARLPGVTLERDEGEGKYVQIRGTAPTLSNLTIDNIIVPSPEGSVRQVKLDTVPAGLIESVQINKTLQANMDADAIGGSVNLVTKMARELPTVSIFGTGGFTPIITTVPVAEAGGTVGYRFGAAKRLGVIVSGGYDYNGRGINDVEPVPDATSVTPNFTSAAIRDYKYDRKRYGVGGSLDYKLGEASTIYVKALYSDFMDDGHRWEYILATGGSAPSITTERRLGDYLVSNLLVGGNHTFSKYWFNWGVAASHSRLLNPISGGESITTFSPTTAPTMMNCQYDAAGTTNKYEPQFTPQCFHDPADIGVYDAGKFSLSSIVDSAHGKSDQVNLAAFASAARTYHLGSHLGTFELGFKIRNGHKFDNSYQLTYTPSMATPPPATDIVESNFLFGFKDPNYYGGAYQFAPNSPSWELVNAYLAGHLTNWSLSSTQGGNLQNFDLIERITAGYLMNTLDFGRFRLIAGFRIEGTDENSTSFDPVAGTLTKKGGGSYVSYLPSASLRIGLDKSSDLKLIYSRAIARPDPVQLAGAYMTDTGTVPPSVIVGNSTLTPEHANNYDLLYERYLKPFGLFQAGFFYKQLANPVVQTLTNGPDAFCTSLGFPPPSPQTTPPTPGCFVSTPTNGGSAYVTGFEIAFLHHFTYLPRLLSGLGVSANYSYTASQATGVSKLRTDNPALLRQAPNTWNISPTYDRGRLSIRIGLAYNQANIFQYAYRDLAPNPANPSNLLPNPQPGGTKGPAGDQYLYSHFQVDAQGSFRLYKGFQFIASGLNLNNEVFGFYVGSPQYPIQREYYKPTYTFGFRWDLHAE